VGLLIRRSTVSTATRSIDTPLSRQRSGTVLIDANPNAGQAPFLLSTFFPNRLTYLSEQQARGPRDVAYNINQYARSSYQRSSTHELCGRTFAADQETSSAIRAISGRMATTTMLTIDPIAGQSSPSNRRPETYFTRNCNSRAVFSTTVQYVVGGFIDRQWPTETSARNSTTFRSVCCWAPPLSMSSDWEPAVAPVHPIDV